MVDKNSINSVFGTPVPEPMSTLIGLVADMSAMSERIHSSTERYSSDIAALKVRAESIDKALEMIAAQDERLKILERNIIDSGEHRMKDVEEKLLSNDRTKAANAKDRRNTIIGIMTTIVTGSFGFLFVHFFDPISHTISSWFN